MPVTDPITDALDTTMPMDDTYAPNVSTEVGVGSGASWRRFSPDSMAAVVSSTTPKPMADTLRLVPHWPEVEGRRRERERKRRVRTSETRMAEVGERGWGEERG